MTCNEYSNALVKTGVQLEDVSYGVAPVSGTPEYLMFQQNSITEENVNELSRSQNGGREVTQIDLIQKLYRGNLNWKVQNGKMLLAAFGDIATTGSGPYEHTFSVSADGTLPSFSTFREMLGRGTSTDKIEWFTGCKVNTLTLDFSEKGMLMATAEVLANGRETTTTKTITGDTTVPFRFADIANASMTVDGTPVRILSGNYKLLNNLSEQQEDETIAEPCAQEAAHELTTTLRLVGDEIKDRLEAADEVEVRIKFDRGTDDDLEIVAQAVNSKTPIDTAVEGPLELQVTWDVRTALIIVNNSVTTYTL